MVHRTAKLRSLLLAGALSAALLAVPGAQAQGTGTGCDPIDPANCLLPFPNDYFMKKGRLALRDSMMPRSKDGVPIAARDYNYSDGFSPGQALMTLVPGLSLPRSGAAPVTNIGRSLAKRQPIVVIDAKTGRRQAIWSELNVVAEREDERVLVVHPAANWREGRRYIVALRGLRTKDGERIGARRAFRVYRDGLPSASRRVNRRRAHMNRIFRSLRKAGVSRRSLYLAWDFTIASRKSLTKRLLSIRDRAFAGLGDRNLSDRRVRGRAPAFRVTEVRAAGSLRRVSGTFDVPCYLDRAGCVPGSRFRLSRRGLPVRTPGNVARAPFVCIVPSTATAANPARPLLFGHGLFGGAEAVDTLPALAQSTNAVICGTDFKGMSSEDVPNALSISGDLSRFPTLVDRSQQGLLNFMFLGRLMLHPQGLSANAAFAGRIDRDELFYAGGSLGGILGGALTAVAPDFRQSALIVPGMNFGVLLTRSTQFRPFAEVIYPTYPDRVDQAVVNSLVQVLWDRGEANGYAWHMTRDPLPDTPTHRVLLHMAFGDHQVANIQTETEARVIGARLRTPALDPGRSIDRRPFYGIKRVRRYPWRGNGLVVFDIGPLRPAGCRPEQPTTCQGVPPPPTTNIAPELGRDPHGITAFSGAAVSQFAAFLRPNGTFINGCGSGPCYAAGWTGP